MTVFFPCFFLNIVGETRKKKAKKKSRKGQLGGETSVPAASDSDSASSGEN